MEQSLLKHIHKLAHLSIEEERLVSLGEDMSNILNYIDKLQELSFDHTSIPISHPLDIKQRMRSDMVVPSDDVNTYYQKNAPKVEKEHYIVPSIIE